MFEALVADVVLVALERDNRVDEPAPPAVVDPEPHEPLRSAAATFERGLVDGVQRTLRERGHTVPTEWTPEVAEAVTFDEDVTGAVDLVATVVEAVELAVDVDADDGLESDLASTVAAVLRMALDTYAEEARSGGSPGTGLVDAVERFADCFAATRRRNDALTAVAEDERSAAERNYRAAVDIAEDAGCRRLAASLHGELASLYESADALDSAAEQLSAALECAQAGDDPDREGRALERLGSLAASRGQPARALERYRAAAERYRTASAPLSRAAVLQRAATLQRSRDELATAADQYEASLDLASEHDDPGLAAAARLGLALVALRQDEPDAAEKLALRSLRQAGAVDDVARQVLALNVAGVAIQRLDGAAVARDRYERALDLVADGEVTAGELAVDDPRLAYLTLMNLGNAAAATDGHEQGAVWYERALECAGALDDAAARERLRERLDWMRSREADQRLLRAVGDRFPDLP